MKCRHGSFCLKIVPSSPNICILETGSLQQRSRCFQGFLEELSSTGLSSLFFDCSRPKESAIRQNDSAEQQTHLWYPRLLQMSIRNPLLLPSPKDLLIGLNRGYYPLILILAVPMVCRFSSCS